MTYALYEHFEEGAWAYATLGLDKCTSLTQIRSKFNQLAMVNHPDKGGDATKWRKIIEARDYLIKNHDRLYKTTTCDSQIEARKQAEAQKASEDARVKAEEAVRKAEAARKNEEAVHAAADAKKKADEAKKQAEEAANAAKPVLTSKQQANLQRKQAQQNRDAIREQQKAPTKELFGDFGFGDAGLSSTKSMIMIALVFALGLYYKRYIKRNYFLIFFAVLVGLLFFGKF
jgi:Ca2+-dependent lipid-binding protein